MKYTITIEKPDMYVASVKELKGCHTQALTLQEVLVRLYEVITLCEETTNDVPENYQLVEQGCGSTKYEGHYICRKGNLCPECEAKLESTREAEPKTCANCKWTYDYDENWDNTHCAECEDESNWTPQEADDE